MKPADAQMIDPVENYIVQYKTFGYFEVTKQDVDWPYSLPI